MQCTPLVMSATGGMGKAAGLDTILGIIGIEKHPGIMLE